MLERLFSRLVISLRLFSLCCTTTCRPQRFMTSLSFCMLTTDSQIRVILVPWIDNLYVLSEVSFNFQHLLLPCTGCVRAIAINLHFLDPLSLMACSSLLQSSSCHRFMQKNAVNIDILLVILLSCKVWTMHSIIFTLNLGLLSFILLRSSFNACWSGSIQYTSVALPHFVRSPPWPVPMSMITHSTVCVGV